MIVLIYFVKQELQKGKIFRSIFFCVIPSKDKKSVKVQFHSTWQTYDVLNNGVNETTPREDILRAILENTVYNVSFKAQVDIKAPTGCPTVEYYPVRK